MAHVSMTSDVEALHSGTLILVAKVIILMLSLIPCLRNRNTGCLKSEDSDRHELAIEQTANVVILVLITFSYNSMVMTHDSDPFLPEPPWDSPRSSAWR